MIEIEQSFGNRFTDLSKVGMLIEFHDLIFNQLIYRKRLTIFEISIIAQLIRSIYLCKIPYRQIKQKVDTNSYSEYPT